MWAAGSSLRISETVQISNHCPIASLHKSKSEVAHTMALIYSVTRDPEEVKRGEIEHESILRAIQMGRSAHLSDKRIALLLQKNFKMLLPYAENYIAEYDREAAKKILAMAKALILPRQHLIDPSRGGNGHASCPNLYSNSIRIRWHNALEAHQTHVVESNQTIPRTTCKAPEIPLQRLAFNYGWCHRATPM